jgi:predicted AlkP superfamily pyrophosphatase or phosphodiesterase
MSKIKYITEELINERLEARGFGEKQQENEETARQNVLNHYGVKLTDDWTDKAEYYIYEETTKDGYSVFVATNDTNSISVCEDVHYYDSDLSDALEEQIKYSNGTEDYPEVIYVDDLYQDFIDGAIENLFIYLSEKFEEEVVNELIEEGYEEQD